MRSIELARRDRYRASLAVCARFPSVDGTDLAAHELDGLPLHEAVALAGRLDRVAKGGEEASRQRWHGIATRRLGLVDIAPADAKRRVREALTPRVTTPSILSLCHVPGTPAYLAISRIAYSVDGERYIELWNLGTGASVRTGHTKHNHCLCLLPGRKLASAGPSDGTVQIWNLDGDLSTPERTFTKEHRGIIYAICHIPSGGLATASPSGFVHLWDLETGTVVHTWQSSSGVSLGSMCHIPAGGQRGAWLATGHRDGTVCLRDLASGGSIVEERKFGTDQIDSMCHVPERLGERSAYLAVLLYDHHRRVVSLWNLDTRDEPVVLPTRLEYINSMCHVPAMGDGRPDCLAVAGGSTVQLWDIHRMAVVRRVELVRYGYEFHLQHVCHVPMGELSRLACSDAHYGTVQLHPLLTLDDT